MIRLEILLSEYKEAGLGRTVAAIFSSTHTNPRPEWTDTKRCWEQKMVFQR